MDTHGQALNSEAAGRAREKSGCTARGVRAAREHIDQTVTGRRDGGRGEGWKSGPDPEISNEDQTGEGLRGKDPAGCQSNKGTHPQTKLR